MLRSAAARRYARALLEIARERGDATLLDRWAAQLDTMAQVVSAPELAHPLENPAIQVEAKQRLVRGALEAAIPGLDPVLGNLAMLLVARGRMALMPAIAEAFRAALNELRGIENAEVTTAIPLDEELRRRFARELSRATRRQVALETRVDPSILGGVILRVGDKLLDASVAGRLAALRRQLV